MALALLALLALADDAVVVTATDAPVAARELSLARRDGRLVVEVVDARGAAARIPAEDVIEITFGARSTPAFRPAAEDVEIRLTTGDVVRGKLGARHEEGARLVNPVLGDPLVPFGRIRAILFPANRAYLPRRPPEKADVADLVFTTTGDRAEGALLSVSADGVVYKSNRREIDVVEPLRNVAGVWLIETEPAPKEPSRLLMTVLTTDGSSLRGEVQSLKDGVLTFKDLYGETRKVARSALAALHVKNGRVVYLSDLEPKAVEEDANYIRGTRKLSSDLDYPFQRDRSARGSPLILGGTEHRKGLGVRAHSSLTYALDGAYTRFQAVAGLDAVSNGLGAVKAEVHIDGKVAASFTFKGNDPPKPVDVDVKGARELRLLVTWAGFGQSDFADWGSARLLR